MYAIIANWKTSQKLGFGQRQMVVKKIKQKLATSNFRRSSIVGEMTLSWYSFTTANSATGGTVEKQGRQKKVVTAFKYKRRRLHRKQGHRQPYTKGCC